MNLTTRLNKHGVCGLIAAALCILLGLASYALTGLPTSQWYLKKSYDLPFALKPTVAVDDVVMVYLDEASHDELHQPYNRPWDRAHFEPLLTRLTRDHARAVVFDIIFSDPGPDPVSDAVFARALRANGRAVLGADYVDVAFQGAIGKKLVLPLKEFRAAARWGIAQLDEANDVFVREHYHGPREAGIPSLSWATADFLDAPVTKSRLRHEERWVNYYGPPGQLPNVSLLQVVSSNGLPPGFTFSNKVVFVGEHLLTYNSGQRKDEFRNPYHPRANERRFMAGTEVHATLFLNLMRGDWLTRPAPAVEYALLILAGFAFGYGLIWLRPWSAVAVSLLGAGGVTVGAHLLFWHEQLWFPWLIIVAAQVPAAATISVVFNSWQLALQKKLLEQSLSLYLSPKLVKKFLRERDLLESKLLKPGAEKQLLTILFSDIANFTSISEGMDSNELALSMNRYFQSAVSQCVHATDGTVVKYIGDAIFAFWNAPEGQVDHQFRASEAALRFRDLSTLYLNGRPLVTRIGLHTGVANVGNFGSTERVDYTALGESINLASRMESLNKHLGTTVLITGEVQQGIEGRLLTRPLGWFRLKGFERSVAVFELLGRPDDEAATRPLRQAFAAALEMFQKRQWPAAQTAFEKLLESFPQDGPTQFYLKHLAELRGQPVPENWTGDVELKEK